METKNIDISNGEIFSDSDTNSDTESATEIVKPNEVFHDRVIGKAGVGKSTHIMNNFKGDEYLLTAFTGIAASRVEAKTLSSIFALGPDSSRVIKVSAGIMYRTKTHIILRRKKYLVIDEFYTLPADIMENVNKLLQTMLNSEEPFGGLKLILVGDDKQTAAVGDSFIHSKLYKSLKFHEIMLPHNPNMRLKPKYMNFCDKFRNHYIKLEKIFKLLEDPRLSKKEVRGYTVYHENKHVDARNIKEMEKLDTPVIGTFRGVEYKQNTPICITNNGIDVYNGMLGKLLSFDAKNKCVEIEFDTYVLECPVKDVKFVPAFAMTINKAQCSTFEGINIYLSRNKISKYKEDNLRLIYTAMTRVSRFSKCYIAWI
jgi:ATP-dependent exoDNAse (exonuclease V) alpha subunit